MSLSPAPKAEITHATARDICDDIWAGAIDYAIETGLSRNPIVTTALWSGLLLSIKSMLDEHGIFEDVQKCFVRSFSDVYHVGLDDVELLADIKGRMQTMCQTLSESMDVIDSESKISAFLDFVSDINAQCAEGTSPLSDEYTRLFSRYTSLLSSHVYSIIYRTDNGMLLQFGGKRRALAQSAQQQPAPIHQPTPQPTAAPSKNVSYEDNTAYGKIAVIVIVVLLIFLVLLSRCSYGDASFSADAPTPTAEQLKEVPKPRNGAILIGSGFGGSQITVTASSSDDCVVSLKNNKGTLRIVFYVRAGQTATVNVPAEYLYVYFASGDTWYGYGEGRMFGEDTIYSMDDDLLDFTEYTWEYTLKPITNGNFSETPIDEDEFF